MTDLSVVVPTEGRYDLLLELLRSAAAAREKSAATVEVLIVDSSDDEERVSGMCDHWEARYLRGSHHVRQKRNLGIRAAAGRYILFVDSDEQVDEALFDRHVARYEDPAIGGVVGLTLFQGADSLSWPIARSSRYLSPFRMATLSERPPWGPCSNISFRRDVLLAVDGFAEDLPGRLGGDDVDLCLRVREAGWDLRSAPDAVTTHDASTWLPLRRTAARGYRWGRMHVHLCQRHAGAAPELPWLLLTCCLFLIACAAFAFAQPLTGAASLIAAAALAAVSVTRPVTLGSILAIPLDAAYGVGAFVEAIRLRRPSLAFRRLVYSDGQARWRLQVLSRQSTALLLSCCLVWLTVMLG